MYCDHCSGVKAAPNVPGVFGDGHASALRERLGRSRVPAGRSAWSPLATIGWRAGPRAWWAAYGEVYGARGPAARHPVRRLEPVIGPARAIQARHNSHAVGDDQRDGDDVAGVRQRHRRPCAAAATPARSGACGVKPPAGVSAMTRSRRSSVMRPASAARRARPGATAEAGQPPHGRSRCRRCRRLQARAVLDEVGDQALDGLGIDRAGLVAQCVQLAP